MRNLRGTPLAIRAAAAASATRSGPLASSGAAPAPGLVEQQRMCSAGGTHRRGAHSPGDEATSSRTTEQGMARPSTASYNTRYQIPRDADGYRDGGESNQARRGNGATSGRHQHRPLGQLLPDIPHGLPNSPTFALERSSSAEEKQWVAEMLPELQQAARRGMYLYPKDDFWQLPAYHALALVVRNQPYSTSLQWIMDHSYFFLLEKDIFLAPDAPLPHLLYEDMQRALTFASLQKPPEEQFQLPSQTLVNLLCMAAYHCTLDPHYFTSAEHLLFKRMEQQQHINAEVLSAFVFVCAAAGQVEKALAMAEFMTAQGLPFSKEIFAAMMHPSVSPVQRMTGLMPHTAKSWLLQERLCDQLAHATGASTTALVVHAMFVHYALTLRHTRKWDVVRCAVQRLRQPSRQHVTSLSSTRPPGGHFTPSAQDLAQRTRQLILETYAKEKGVRCGPEATKAVLAVALQPTPHDNFHSSGAGEGVQLDKPGREDAAADAAEVIGDTLFVVLRTRRNEETPLFDSTLALPRTSFAEEETEAIMQLVSARLGKPPQTQRTRHAIMDSPRYDRRTEPASSPAFLQQVGDDGIQEQGSDKGVDPYPSSSTENGVGFRAPSAPVGEKKDRIRRELPALLQHLLQMGGNGDDSVTRERSTSASPTATDHSVAVASREARAAQLKHILTSLSRLTHRTTTQTNDVRPLIAAAEEDFVSEVVARMRYLDSLGREGLQQSHAPPLHHPPQDSVASQGRGGAPQANLVEPLDAAEKRLAQERAQLQVRLANILFPENASSSAVGGGGDDAWNSSSSGMADGGVPADLTPEQRAWSAKVTRDEGEDALLAAELQAVGSKYM